MKKKLEQLKYDDFFCFLLNNYGVWRGFRNGIEPDRASLSVSRIVGPLIPVIKAPLIGHAIVLCKSSFYVVSREI